MYNVIVETVPKFRMFDLAMGLHVVAAGKLLATYGALVALWPVNVGMVPTVRNGFMATDATVQGGERSGQLDEQRRVVNVVVASGRVGRAATAVASGTASATISATSTGSTRCQGKAGTDSRWCTGQ